MVVVIYDFSTLILTEFYSAAVHHKLFTCLTSQNEFNSLIMHSILQHWPLKLMNLNSNACLSVDVQYVAMHCTVYRLNNNLC